MLSQVFMLSLGEALLKERLPTRHARMLAFGTQLRAAPTPFPPCPSILPLHQHTPARTQPPHPGSPRVGDEGLRARLRLLFPIQSRLLNIVYPLDTIHAFPPSAEGYADAVVKVFLRQPGQFTARRNASNKASYANPLTWLRVFDSKVDEMRAAAAVRSRRAGRQQQQAAGEKGKAEGAKSAVDGGGGSGDGGARDPLLGEGACGLCGSEGHTTGRHRCHVCTERGSHRAAACPNRGKGCALCGAEEHATGEHECGVCKLKGHRGRNCHDLRSVGWAELASYSLFHDFHYYALATQQEEEGLDFRPQLASAATATPPVSPNNAAGSGSDGDTPPRILSGSKGATAQAPGSGADADAGEKAGMGHRLFGVFGGLPLDEADVEAIADVNHL